MSDRNSYQELIDQGWRKMSVLLDQEMPGRKRRRGAIWWFTGLAALVLMGTFAALSVSEKGERHPDIENTPTQLKGNETNANDPIASLDEPETEQFTVEDVLATKTTQDQNKTVRKSENTLANNSLRNNTQVNASGKKNALPALEVEAGPKVSDQGIAIGEETSKSDLPTTGSIIESTDARANESESVSDEHEPVKESVVPVSPEFSITFTSPSSRDEISVGALESESLEDLATPVEFGSAVIPSTKQSRKSVELQGLAAMHLNSEGNPFYGVEAGGVVVFRADKKLRVRTGLNYAYYSVDGIGLLAFGKSSDAESQDVDPGTGVGTLYDPVSVVSNTIEYDAADRLTDKFHYLHVPLLLEFRATPRWSVTAGARMGLLLGAPARYKLNDERFSANYQATAPGSRSFLYDYGILRKIDIAPELMISWKAGNRLWIDAGYIHGIVPYINRSDISGRNDYHRMVQVGARYTII